LGWATITHPFHPFRNQRFKVLKHRKLAGADTIVLHGTYRGTFAVPLEWTDQAIPDFGNSAQAAARFLSIHRLVELVDLVEHIENKRLDR
jgi:hypothetical protein